MKGGGAPLKKLPAEVGDFECRYMGGDIYRLTIRGTQKYIEQTGAQVNTRLEFPFGHQLLKIELKHTDNADDDSTDALTYAILYRGVANLMNALRSGSGVTASDVLEVFGDEYIHSETVYLFETNTTNTDRIYITMYIRALLGA